jgi:hypothetical protein
MLIVYIFFCFTNKNMSDEFLKLIQNEFEMNIMMGGLKYFFGL